MGKKAKLKAIRKIANTMPDIMTVQMLGEAIIGDMAIKDGIKEIDGNPVDPNNYYRRKTPVQNSLNHNRKMKQLYNQYGAKAVSEYIAAVAQYEAMEQIKKEMNETKQDAA
jgi:hypothetical protein